MNMKQWLKRTISMYVTNHFCGSGVQGQLSRVAQAKIVWEVQLGWARRLTSRMAHLGSLWKRLSSSPWPTWVSSWPSSCQLPETGQDGSYGAFYNPASGDTLSHFYTILPVPQGSPFSDRGYYSGHGWQKAPITGAILELYHIEKNFFLPSFFPSSFPPSPPLFSCLSLSFSPHPTPDSCRPFKELKHINWF